MDGCPAIRRGMRFHVECVGMASKYCSSVLTSPKTQIQNPTNLLLKLNKIIIYQWKVKKVWRVGHSFQSSDQNLDGFNF